jgi:hypothetical protein
MAPAVVLPPGRRASCCSSQANRSATSGRLLACRVARRISGGLPRIVASTA